MQPLLTPGDVANLLQVSKGHIYRLVQLRRIPFLKRGGSIRFRPESIERWIIDAEVVSVNKALKQVRERQSR